LWYVYHVDYEFLIVGDFSLDVSIHVSGGGGSVSATIGVVSGYHDSLMLLCP
jgi:hypothetical protein